MGFPGDRYWKAFGVTLGAMVVIVVTVTVLVVGPALGVFGAEEEASSTTPARATQSAVPTASEAAPQTTVAPTTTRPPATAQAAPTYQAITTLPSGSWLTVLDSLDKNQRSETDAWTIAISLSQPSAQVVVVDSDVIAGLNPGYWAVAVVGSTSRAQATDLCAALGRSVSGSCYPRQVG